MRSNEEEDKGRLMEGAHEEGEEEKEQQIKKRHIR